MRSTKIVSLWGPAQTQVYRLYACIIPFEITFLWQTTETKKRNKRVCNKNVYPPTRGEKKSLWSAQPPENFLGAWKKPYLRKIPHVVASSYGSGHAGNGTIVPRAVLPWEKNPSYLKESHWPQPKRTVVRSLRALTIEKSVWSMEAACVDTLPVPANSRVYGGKVCLRSWFWHHIC